MKSGDKGTGFTFTFNVVGGKCLKEFLPAIEQVFIVMQDPRVLAGFPVLDVEVEVFDGGFHAVDSSAVAF